jgi:hypothetical protein
MEKTRTRLTSVNVDKKNHQQFKIMCIENNITFQLLVNKCIEMYVHDKQFRELINNK